VTRYTTVMSLTVSAGGEARWRGRKLRCAIGRGGISDDKREGDGATPAGLFPVRRVLYRADRVSRPECVLPSEAIAPADGWCDDPTDPLYNQRVQLPYAGRCEALWRDDALYDVVGVLGFNDAPAVPGRGSAIFLHVARPDFGPTEGCVALSRRDLLDVLKDWRVDDRVIVIA